MHELKVGELYHPSRANWPELAQYNFRNGDHELVLFYGNPSPLEIEACRKGDTRFGLVASGPAIVLLYKVEGLGDWSDAPFNWHNVPEDQRQLPVKPLGEERAGLWLLLVDADTGVLKSIRRQTWSHAFTEAMHDAIRRQATLGEAEGFDAEVDRLFKTHPDGRALAKIAHPTCKGGE